MALIDNSPTTKWIRWRDLLITYEENTYQIQNSETNLKYVYWDVTNPYTLQCFNRTQNQKPGFYQLFINERGMATERSHEDLVVSWDGNNSNLIMNQIFGLHEENKQTGNKFVAMETDINGIRNTVGQTQQSVDELKENVTKIEQKADKIDLSVKELNQEFTDNREVNELRENLNKSMIDFNSSLGIFKSEIYTYYKDNKIDEEEKIKINTHLDIMDSKRAEVVKYVDVVVNLMQNKDQTTEVNKLNSAKKKFVNSVSNLRTYITTAISDNTVVPSEMTGITDLFAKCSIAINELKNSCDDCIFLGAGGRITEELAQISMKSDEILLSVSKTEEDIRSNLSIEKNLLQGNITDLRNAIDQSIKTLRDTFKDGKISNAELEIINLRISEKIKEKNDIDNKYNDTYNNQYITQSTKAKLKLEYDKFNIKFTEMIDKIREVISDEFVNEAEQAQVETVINEVLSSITILHTLMCQSLDDIQLNVNKAEIKAAKDEVQGNINEVNDRVNDLNEYVDGTFEDNILDEAERKNIKSNLENISREKIDIDNQYTQLSGNSFLDGILKTNYTTAYNNFLSKYNALLEIIEGILKKSDLINNTDRDNINKGYTQLNETIGLYVRVYNEVIEYIAKKEAEHVKTTLDKDISDVDSKINDLNENINGVFKSGIIDESERNSIALNLKDLETQKADVDNKYNQWILSPYLDGTLKIEFEEKYNNLVEKYNNLVKVMNDILEKTELINDTDRNKLNTTKDIFNLAIGEFSRVVNKIIEYVGKKQSESAVGDFSKQLEDLNTKVDNIMDDVGGAIADDLIDETERIAIKQSLKNLENDYISNEVEYQKIYNNPNLVGDIKNELNTHFNIYASKYSNLVNAINYLLNKIGNIDDIDRANLDSAYMEYGTSIRSYLSKFYEAMESITNKGINDAKNEINKELNDLTLSLGDLENTMNGVFKDGILSESKKEAIRQNLQTLATEKADIDKSYSTVYNNSNLIGIPKIDLKNSYDLYVIEYNNLIKVIDEILKKVGNLDSTDQSKLDTAFLKHRTSLSGFKEKYNIAIDSITNKAVNDAKNAMQGEISELNGALSDLETTMNGAFKQGVLSDAEKLAMKQHLQIVSTEKMDVEKQFTSLYENPDLIGDAKTNLKSSYDTYILKYNNLISTINEILNKVGLLDSIDQTNLNNAFNEYRVSSGEYSKRVNESIDSIAKKKSDDAEKNSKRHTEAQIKMVNDEIKLKVSQVEYDNNNKEINKKISEVKQTTGELSLMVETSEKRISEGFNKISNSTFSNGTTGWRDCDNSYMVINEGVFTDMIDYKNQTSKVHFIYGYPNGQSDCQLIQTITGKNILVDAGLESQGGSFVKYLKDLGITRLDYVFATHAHSDHIGGMPAIIDNFDIGVFYGINPDPSILDQEEIEWETMKYWQRVKDALHRKNMDVTWPIAGIQLSKYDRLDVYNIKEPTPKMNDMSLVLKYTHMANKIVLSGDVEFADEERIASQIGSVDVLKLGHHGLDTSTGYEYISKLNPNMTIMTTTANLSSQRIPVLTRLQLEGVTKNISQGTMGTIIITSDGTKYSSNIDKDISLYNAWGKVYNTSYFFDWGGKPVDGFRTIYSYNSRNVDYYFKDNAMKVGWIEVNVGESYPRWYYAADGTDGIYYLGELVKGFMELSWSGQVKNWYYFDLNTHEMLRSKWVKHTDGHWYYMKEHGEMARNETLWIEDDYYTFDANGRMQ